MSETTTTRGGFTGDPAAGLSVTGTGGCCGDPATAATPPDPATPIAGPCCGTAAEAQTAGACCGSAAKAEALSAGAGCCG